jgi:hypothetical protein
MRLHLTHFFFLCILDLTLQYRHLLPFNNYLFKNYVLSFWNSYMNLSFITKLNRFPLFLLITILVCTKCVQKVTLLFTFSLLNPNIINANKKVKKVNFLYTLRANENIIIMIAIYINNFVYCFPFLNDTFLFHYILDRIWTLTMGVLYSFVRSYNASFVIVLKYRAISLFIASRHVWY